MKDEETINKKVEFMPVRTKLNCPFCGGGVDPSGWLDGNGNRGPECEMCGATAPDMETWNKRWFDSELSVVIERLLKKHGYKIIIP